MSNLLASFGVSAGALDAFSQALDVVQQNITNASTPGYAKRSVTLESEAFQPERDLVGGVRTGDLASARNEYADQEVRQSISESGRYDQKATSLEGIESLFDVTGNGGVDAALNTLVASFSAWSASPDSVTARQTVLDSADGFAQAFRELSAGLEKASAQADDQIGDTVDQINRLAKQIRTYNEKIVGQTQQDAGLDASLHAALESLSELADVSATTQPDGSVTVMLGGQSPLVIGSQQYDIRSDVFTPSNPPPVNPGGAPSVRILDAQGNDVSATIFEGKLGALLDFRNQFIPGLIGNANEDGSVNQLAKGVADRVNQILNSGAVSLGPPVQNGAPLFVYDTTNNAATARSLVLNPAITPDQLAAIDPGPPSTANGAALSLAGLNSDPANQLNGMSYVQFYSSVVAGVGNAISEAKNSQSISQQAAVQARSLQSQLSGVSLDDEAVQLIEFQRAYEAAAKTFQVLGDLTQTAVNLIR